MENSERLERLGKRFPNKSIGIGNPDAKILVVTPREGNEKADFKYLKKLFMDLPETQGKEMDILEHCYYLVFDEELLKDPFFEHFQIIQYAFIDGTYLSEHNPAPIFGMEWVSNCIVEDGGYQRLFVAHSNPQDGQKERVMFLTYSFDNVSKTIFCCNKLLLNWIFRNEKGIFFSI